MERKLWVRLRKQPVDCEPHAEAIREGTSPDRIKVGIFSQGNPGRSAGGINQYPGMGKMTAMLLIVHIDVFTSFENARQLCCFTGITPTIRQSGTSVRGRSRISKVGNRKHTNLLFLCSFTACKNNKACMEIFERIVEKGKIKKIELIAVCNKLLK